MSADTRDWTKAGTAAGFAEYLRGKSDALLVLVIRPNDAALAADAALKPEDVAEAIALRLEELVADLRRARAERKASAQTARVKWEELQ